MSGSTILEPTLRMPPHDSEAEMAIAATMMVDPTLIPVALELFDVRDMFHEEYREICKAAIHLWTQGGDVHQLSVGQYLTTIRTTTPGNDNLLQDIGGHTKLGEIIRYTMDVSETSLRFYGEIVSRTAKQRNLVAEATKLLHMAYEASIDPDEAAAITAGRLLDQPDSSMGTRQIGDVLAGMTDRVVDWMSDPSAIRGTPTGWRKLDRIIGGLVTKRVIVVSALSGIGKSLFIQNGSRQIAEWGEGVLIFTTEMSDEEYAWRILMMEAGIDPAEASDTGRLSEWEKESVGKAQHTLSKARIHTCPRGKLSVGQIIAEMRRYNLRFGIKHFIIDHYDMVSGDGENRTREIAQITGAIKAFAQDMDVNIIAVSHMNRGRGDTGALENDRLRDGGTKEQDADQVLLFEPVRPCVIDGRDDWETIPKSQTGAIIKADGVLYMRCYVSKNRWGREGMIYFAVQWRTTEHRLGGGRIYEVYD